MFPVLFRIFLLLHLLGDFYFQTDEISKRKKRDYRYVVRHGALYAAVCFLGAAPVWSARIAGFLSVLAVLHFAIDSLKYLCTKSRPDLPDSAVYFTDQLLHLASIVTVAAVASSGGGTVSLLPEISRVLMLITGGGGQLLNWICVLLIICKPANITIKQFLSGYKPPQTDEASSQNAGAFIGTLERIIIVLLLSVNQYSAIGLVLTAKSVARYDKISKDQAFSEYYLLGTLLSALFAIAAFFVLT